jgi:two-component system cell cycle sensor histidine kinase/response regulator CckA
MRMMTPRDSKRKVSVTVKLLLSVFAIVFVMIAVQAWLNIYNARQRNETEESRNLIALFDNYNDEVEMLTSTSAVLASSFADRPDVQELVLAQDRQGLIELLSPIFTILKTNYDIVRLYVYQPNGVVLVRVNDPERYGDPIPPHRRTSIAALETHQTVAGVELDPHWLGVRGIAPMFHQGEFIGLVEVGLDYDQAFIKDLKTRNGADYKMWITFDAATPNGLWPTGDEPASPSARLFYYASTNPLPLPIEEEVYLRVLAEGQPEIQFVSADAQEWAVLVAPLMGYGNRTIGVLEISTSRTPVLAALRRSQLTTLSAAGGLALAALVLMWIATDVVVLRSLRHLTAVTRRQLAGDLTARVRSFPNDEFGQLGRAFNSMTEQLTGLVGHLEQQVETVKRAEAALRESEERYRVISDLISDIAYAVRVEPDGATALEWVTEALPRITGFTPDELEARGGWLSLLHPDDTSILLQHLQAHLSDWPDASEYRIITKEGEVRWLRDYTHPVWDETQGRVVRIIGAAQDITERVRSEMERRQAEEALQHNEQHFRALTENASDIIMVLNADGTIQYGSPAVERLLGYKSEDFIGETPSEFIHPDDLPTVRHTFIRAIREPGVTLQIEFRLRHQDGSWRMVEAIGNNLLDDPAVKGIVINARNITERVRSEMERRQAEEGQRKALAEALQATQALRESESNLKRAQHIAHLGSWNLDLETQNFTISEELMHICQYEGGPTVSVGMDEFAQCIHPDDRKRVIGALDDAIAGRAPYDLEFQIVHPNGAIRILHAQGDVIRDEADRPIRMVGTGLDITDRKRAEEERERLWVQIQEQARQVQQIIDTVPEGVLLLDAGGRVALANPVAERDLSVLAGAKVGDTLTHLGDRRLAELLTSPPKGLWHEVQAIAPHEQGGRTFEVIARPIENGPEPEDWVLVINDVTREREIQQRAQQQERLAAVGQLAAGIAHDFNNIMATIVLYAQMTVRMKELPTTVRERMGMINGQAQHATRLIQQILDFSRRAVLERRPLDLLPLVKEQVKLLERTLPEHIEIELVYGPDEDAAPLLVNADPTRMQQMMTNLALNARDAMPEGGILRIGLERIWIEKRKAAPLPEMKAGEWVQIMVSDTGTGIPSDVLPHIYEPFFTTRAPLGSGLGLAQVHGIVAQHGGHIDVASQVGEGTTFTIYLPAMPIHQLETSPHRTEHLIQGEGQTILVVEDNAAARQALMDSLELLNYQVREAANGQEALAVLERHSENITLVLSDVVMPGMGGAALFHTLREKYPAVRVVLLTGHPMEGTLKDLRAQGLHGWLFKPPSLEQLAEVIAQVLRDKKDQE